MKVCFSGTFNALHKGHKHLIDKAFQTAGETGMVYIGITNGEMLKRKKKLNHLIKELMKLRIIYPLKVMKSVLLLKKYLINMAQLSMVIMI